jgi:hypothetical protein
MNMIKAYPNSRWWTHQADCYKCVAAQFEKAAPRIWDLFALEKVVEREGMIDAG